MVFSPIFLIIFGFSTINNCLSMVIPKRNIISSNNTTSLPTHILRVRMRFHNSLIETLADNQQLNFIEVQLQTRNIPYREIQDNKDGITIIIGPVHKSVNLTATLMMFNQSRFRMNFTKIIPIKTDSKNETVVLKENQISSGHFPLSVEAQEYNLVYDQESYDFRHCLESCEIYKDNELQPNHDCIRDKCLKEIIGI